MTNADKIRAMSDYELAVERVSSILGEDDRVTYYTTNGNFDVLEDAIDDELKWLKSDVEEN